MEQRRALIHSKSVRILPDLVRREREGLLTDSVGKKKKNGLEKRQEEEY